MDKYASRVRTPDENLSFLEEHPQLLHEHCMGYLLMEALQLGMDDKKARALRCACMCSHARCVCACARPLTPLVCARCAPCYARRTHPRLR
jgi:hypothetical protein